MPNNHGEIRYTVSSWNEVNPYIADSWHEIVTDTEQNVTVENRLCDTLLNMLNDEEKLIKHYIEDDSELLTSAIEDFIKDMRGRSRLRIFNDLISKTTEKSLKYEIKIVEENNKLMYSPWGMITNTYSYDEIKNALNNYLTAKANVYITSKILNELLEKRNGEWWNDEN